MKLTTIVKTRSLFTISRNLTIMKNALLISTLIFLLGSCRTDLTEQEIKWIPYKKGEILVFKSSNQELDSFKITGITSSYLYDNEILEVKCQYLEKSLDTYGNLDTVNSFLIALTAEKDNQSVFTLNLNRKFARFTPFVAKRLSLLDSMQVTSIEVNNRIFNDVLIFEPDNSNPEYLNYAEDSIFVNKVYWSKSYGLIKFDLSNNKTSWHLTKRYRQ